MIRHLLFACSLITLTACSDSSGSKPDAGKDASSLEVGTPDSIAFDLSSPDTLSDARADDGGALDAGAPDTNAPDAPTIEPVLDAAGLDLAGLDSGAQSSPPDGAASDTSALDGSPRDVAALACDEATHDPILGTAKLAASYYVVDSTVLPTSAWLPVALVDEAQADGRVGQVVYGYSGDGRVHRLGVWPNIVAPDASNVAFDAISPADRASQFVTASLLVTTRGQLLASYRTLRSAAFVGGGISIYDTVRPEEGVRRMAATGVEGALGLGSYFLVGGDGVGTAASGRGVYGVDTDDTMPLPGLVAKYPVLPGENVRPGLMALAANGVVVMGYYLDIADRHSLRMPEPSRLMEALSGGPVIDLSEAPELTSANDVANLAAFGQGVAVLHSKQARGILPALGRLDHYTLSRAGGDAGTAVGTPVTILSADDDACTAVSQLVPVTGAMNLVVGLWDRNGQRLVRLAPR